MHGRSEKFVQHFSLKTLKEEIGLRWDNINI
jgi:hypothetical protein